MNVRDVVRKALEVAQSWETLRPHKTFFGLKLEEFKATIKPSQDERAVLADLRGQVQAAKTRCHDADVRLVDVVQGVVNAVKGDPEEGEDGELYVALGYTRRSARRRGRPRLRSNGALRAPEQRESKPQEEVKPQNDAA